MTAILSSIAILIALLLALLAVPITVMFRVDGINEVKGHVTFCWLFGLVRFRILIPTTAHTKPRQGRQPAKKSGKLKRTGSARRAFSLLTQRAIRQRGVRFIKDIFRATNPGDLYLRLRIGLGDPADTGRLWAVLGPAAGMATNLRSAVIRIEPEFIDPVLEFESQGQFRLIPLRFIALVAGFVVSPTTMRTYRTLRGSNR